MRRTTIVSVVAALVMAVLVMADQSRADVYRYRLSGNWTTVTDGTSEGWGLNPNNDGSPGIGLPGAADDARINWGGNTVTVDTAITGVSKVQIGVDESGNVVVESGGVLTGNRVYAGHNNANATGTLTVNDGGIVNVGDILWAANNDSDGLIDINSGGVVTVGSHLWWGVSGTATIDISGSITQTGGILGLGTSNASTPGGGTATVNVLDGGLLALNNISSADGLPSIQPGSLLNIIGTGQVTVPNDFVGVLTDYAIADKLAGNGVPGLSNLVIDFDITNPGFTTVTTIPEPSTLLLLGLGLGGVLIRRRR